ncbi:MAG: tetratricopeptide repeat protein, partial [Pirellulaceae bacterium]|nr:tetratricopeptide repeat protein [Pirellulaceae bacterium]
VLAARDQDRMAAELLTTTRDRLQGEINSLTEQRDALLAEADSLSGEEKQKHGDQAEQLANRIRGWKALQTEIWGSLVRLADRQKDWDASDKLIRNAQESLGDGVQARLLRARSLARRHGADAASEIRKLLDNTEEFSAAERIQLWYTLAAIAFNVGDYETVRKNCRSILELEPANLDVHKLRFQLAATEGDIDEMDESLERIKQIEGKPSAFRHYAEARRLLAISEKGGSDELLRQALSQLTLAEQLSPRWEAISVLAGTIHEKLGQSNAAIDAYLEAIELGDDNPALVRRVAQLLIRANRLQEADRMFRQLAERQQVLSGDLERQISWVKTRMGDFDAAIDPARKTAAATNKTEDLVWLGQLLGIVGRRMQSEGQDEEARVLFDEGEQALRRAVVQKMDAPEPWIALIQFYGQAGQKEKARQTINRARLTLTTTAAATVLGQCYEVLDELDKAAEQYEIAVQANPKDPKIALQAAAFLARAKRIDEAKSHYLRVIQGKVDAEAPMKAEARRGMASLLSEQGGIENRRLAIEWLDRNLAETPDSVADQVLKAAILASDPSGRRHHEALSLLEKLATGKQQISPQVRFALAQLYHADNNWRQYNLHMRKLLETYRDVPEYIAAYVNALTEKGDYVEADIWVSELARVAPNSPQTIALRAELAFAERQFDRTQKILRDYIEDPKATDSERDSRLPIIAESLESYAKRLRVLGEPETGRLFSEEANRAYRRYVDAKPGRDLHMAAFLARQERIDDAITMVESLRESSHPDQLAVACFRIINGTGPSLEQLNRVDEILRKAIEQYPGNQILQIATAVVRSFQDRFEDAEALYRELLRQSPDNPTAMNNLAVLLARQGVKLDEAAKLIDRAIELAGENDELLESRAVVQLALKRPEKALEDLQKALGTKPTAMRFFHQAEAFRDIGQRKAAVDAFKKAGRLGLREDYLTGVELRKYKALKMALE